jgi:3-dehydroquinate dehydratase/shikimate dehydrogenase
VIIISITGPSMKEALRQIASSERYADMFEFRLDLIRRCDLRRLLPSTKKAAIATCRPTWEGGAYGGEESERFRMLLRAADAGAKYLDIELKAFDRFRRALAGKPAPCRLIVSRHLRTASAAKARESFDALEGTGADCIKLAYPAGDAADIALAREFLSRARRRGRKGICIAMGEAGEASRILYRKFGGWATYAAAESGEPAAPGQVKGKELKTLFRAHRLNRATKVFGVVGNPVSQSKGIYLHNSLFRGLNSVYCRFPVIDLPRFMSDVSPILRGFSVTLPHKSAILKYLEDADAAALGIGAANTVLRKGKQLTGTNSDARGALDAIEKVRRVRGTRMLILGAGGAARAIAFEARRRGASITIANRTASRGRRLARELAVHSVPWSEIPATPCDIVVNATPVGMSPHAKCTPVPARLLKAKVVFDCVYNPPVTRLLREARRRGARVVSGVEMFLNQAAIQSRLYTGRVPDRAVMKRVVARYL